MCDSIAEGGRRCELQTPSSRAKYRKKNQRPATTGEARAKAKRLAAKGLYDAAGVVSPIQDGMSDADIEAKRVEINAAFQEHPELNPMSVRKKRKNGEATVHKKVGEEVEPAPRRRSPKPIVSRSVLDLIPEPELEDDEQVEDPDLSEPTEPETQAQLIQKLNRLKGSRVATIRLSHQSRGEMQVKAKETIVKIDTAIRRTNDALFASMN
ncbi:hypothetical protein [Rathayibacter agropyri]